MVTKCKRRGEGKSGMGTLLVVGVFLYFLANTNEGKRLFQNAVQSTQPPVFLSLTPYAIETGYYLNVTNLGTKPLFLVKVDFMDAQGLSREIYIGTIKIGETKKLDPSQVNWRIAPNESIGVSAADFIKKVVDTNVLIQTALP